MLMDYHLHSSFSGDGHSAVEEICRAARAAGLTHIAITDHHDIGHGKFALRGLDQYVGEIHRAAALFPDLDVACGMEMDYREETWDEMRRIPERIGLDFALLSLHYVDGVDPYLPEYFEGRGQRAGYSLYLERLAGMIRDTEGPWVLGHITYVAKFARFDDPVLRYDNYKAELDEVLRLAVAKGYGLEANTSGMRNGAGLLPGADILRRFRELGGRAVTVGSDAHSADSVGGWVGEALEAVRGAGFGQVAAFRALKPVFLDIP
jgi:histidinol-phosphatase (PHP family)